MFQYEWYILERGWLLIFFFFLCSSERKRQLPAFHGPLQQKNKIVVAFADSRKLGKFFFNDLCSMGTFIWLPPLLEAYNFLA